MKSKYRIVFLGNQAVGKTTLISQYVYKQSDQNYHPTIGIDYLSTQIRVNNEMVKIQLWDTAGQERFNSIIPNYTRDCFMAIIVYDLTDPRSFDAIHHWIEDLVRINDEEGKVKIVIVGNKKDLMIDNIKKEVKNRIKNADFSDFQKKDVDSKSTSNVTSRIIEINSKENILMKKNNSSSAAYSIEKNSKKILDYKDQKDNNNSLSTNELNLESDKKENEAIYNEEEMINILINRKVEEGKNKAKQYKGNFVMTTAMNYDDIKDLVSVITKLVENDVKETGNVIDLGDERETVNLITKTNKKCCF